MNNTDGPSVSNQELGPSKSGHCSLLPSDTTNHQHVVLESLHPELKSGHMVPTDSRNSHNFFVATTAIILFLLANVPHTKKTPSVKTDYGVLWYPQCCHGFKHTVHSTAHVENMQAGK